eukprot:6212231-Pleurochrysis_carterae.AAC.1
MERHGEQPERKRRKLLRGRKTGQCRRNRGVGRAAGGRDGERQRARGRGEGGWGAGAGASA